MQLPRASKGVVPRDEAGSEVGSKWHRAEMMGRALPEPGELGEGHPNLLQPGRTAWKDSKSWTQWGSTKHINKWRSGAPNHEARGRPKADICKEWEGKSVSECCNKTTGQAKPQQDFEGKPQQEVIGVLWEEGLHLSKKGSQFLSCYFLFLIVE